MKKKMKFKNLSNNALIDIVDLLDGKYDTSQDIKLREHTPKVMLKCGLEDYEMLMNSKHIICNIITIKEAKEMGIYNKRNNYHGLGVYMFLDILNSIDNPIGIYRWINNQYGKYNENNYVILTSKKINQESVIVPIYINTTGNYNYLKLATNKIKSVYSIGNENTLDRKVEFGYMEKIYSKKKTNIATTVNTAATGNSFSNENISYDDSFVKFDRYYKVNENGNSNILRQEYFNENYYELKTEKFINYVVSLFYDE